VIAGRRKGRPGPDPPRSCAGLGRWSIGPAGRRALSMGGARRGRKVGGSRVGRRLGCDPARAWGVVSWCLGRGPARRRSAGNNCWPRPLRALLRGRLWTESKSLRALSRAYRRCGNKTVFDVQSTRGAADQRVGPSRTCRFSIASRARARKERFPLLLAVAGWTCAPGPVLSQRLRANHEPGARLSPRRPELLFRSASRPAHPRHDIQRSQAHFFPFETSVFAPAGLSVLKTATGQ